MMNKVFLDTNILVYSHDKHHPEKRIKAREVLGLYENEPDRLCISTQVLQEFYNALTRKLAFSAGDAKLEMSRNFSLNIQVLTPKMILAAADLHGSDSISFWDALIVVAAQIAQCDELWSEDLQTGRTYGSLKIVNPFL